MRVVTRTFFTLYLLAFGSSVAAEQPLQLFASPAPPYQYGADGEIRGSTVDALRCALSETPWRPHIQMVPQRRASHSLQKGVIDGYLGIAPSAELNKHAVISAPLALEKWYLYSEQPVESLDGLRLGAIAGSNEAMWLERRGYDVTMQVATLEQLVALIDRQRIDGLVVDSRVMEAYLEQQEAFQPAPGLDAQFIRFAPLGLYLGNNFVNVHPDFLARLNARLDDCVTSGFQLDEKEAGEVLKQARALFANLQQQVNLEAALRSARNDYTLAEILMIDQLWQQASVKNPTDEALAITANPTSLALEHWQASHNGRITELMLIDHQGALVAMSRLTSDFWQGDESKFREVVANVDKGLFLSPVRFDASSRHFQVIASKSIFDDRSGELIGVVAIGLDIEKALSGLH
ncbi:hypothetical protein RE428_39250 [Marinobacter nanhaiticus D15-8W]|nr:transporter substrate-binding domain-containing protein [Marinobacter nanhaiticus]BES72907.1 hypothetical protein RE428_39250 [Marinobacter nanhaiticus D15-8W]